MLACNKASPEGQQGTGLTSLFFPKALINLEHFYHIFLVVTFQFRNKARHLLKQHFMTASQPGRLMTGAWGGTFSSIPAPSLHLTATKPQNGYKSGVPLLTGLTTRGSGASRTPHKPHNQTPQSLLLPSSHPSPSASPHPPHGRAQPRPGACREL